MYGWKARIGIVFPSRGDTCTYEFYKMAPEGMILVHTINNVEQLTTEYFEKALARVDEGVRLLLTEKVDAIIVSGTPVLASHGMEKYEELVQHLRQKSPVPVSTDLESAVDAMRELGAERIVVASPYKEELNNREVMTLEHFGLKVVHIKGLGIQRNAEITTLPTYASYRCAMEAVGETTEEFDAVFLTCPRWATLCNVATLERNIGKPVVTTSTTMFWKSMRLTGINERITGFGKLLGDS